MAPCQARAYKPEDWEDWPELSRRMGSCGRGND